MFVKTAWNRDRIGMVRQKEILQKDLPIDSPAKHHYIIGTIDTAILDLKRKMELQDENSYK